MAFSLDRLRKIVNALPVSSAPGPDGMTYLLIRFGGDTLLRQCLRLFTHLLSVGDIPEAWRRAIVFFPYIKEKDRKWNVATTARLA